MHDSSCFYYVSFYSCFFCEESTYLTFAETESWRASRATIKGLIVFVTSLISIWVNPRARVPWELTIFTRQSFLFSSIIISDLSTMHEARLYPSVVSIGKAISTLSNVPFIG